MPYINKVSSLKGVLANNHSRFDLPCEGAKNTNGQLHACINMTYVYIKALALRYIYIQYYI